MKNEAIDIKFFSNCFDLKLEVVDRGENRFQDVKRYYAIFKNASEYDNGILRGSHGNGSTEKEAISSFSEDLNYLYERLNDLGEAKLSVSMQKVRMQLNKHIKGIS